MKQPSITTWLIGAVLVAVTTAFAPSMAEAKRFGGGKSVGMQRTPAPTPPPTKQATPNQTAAPTAGAAPAAAPKRSWMGPLAGLAAGLGIAALMSHLGLSEAMGNIIVMVLLAVVAVGVIRFVMRRMAGAAGPQAGAGRPGMPQYAMAGAGAGAHGDTPSFRPEATPTLARSNLASPAMAGGGSVGGVPAGFDAEGFERIAKMIFIRLQAANDTADLNDLRTFTTPEMFAAVKLDLQDRGNAAQQTDVVRVDAEVLDLAEEDDRQVVSVRFHGLIREELGGTAHDFDEVWHLVKPHDDSRGWMIAGIAQRH